MGRTKGEVALEVDDEGRVGLIFCVPSTVAPEDGNEGFVEGPEGEEVRGIGVTTIVDDGDAD